MKKYKIIYDDLFRKDLEKTYFYIADTLNAPQAAGNLLEEIEKAIVRTSMFPFACRIWESELSLPEEFRMLSVKNYAIFYVVKEDVVEIRRLVYAKMDLKQIYG